MLPRHRLLASAISALLCTPVLAQTPAATDGSGDDADTLSTITVTATKTEREVDDTPGTVTVKEREELDREIVTDIRDLVRYEPGVSVANSPARFGLNGFTIRGIDANRVLIEIDGVRVPDAFSIGSFSNAGRDLVDVDLLKRVEIVRGAASSLYGSNAIGGVVSFQTKDPEDYLVDGKQTHLGVKGGWYGADDGRYGGLTAAVGGEKVSFLLGFSHREGRETENMGEVDALSPTRTVPNPQNYGVDSALAKVVVKPADGHRLEFAFETGRGDTQTDVFTGRSTTSSGPPGAPPTSIVRVLDLTGDDRQERSRYGLEYTFAPVDAFVDEVRMQAYHQQSETTQDTFELRETTQTGPGTVTPQERYREFNFDQDVTGAEVLLRKDFAIGATGHRLIVGGEYIETDIAQMRDGFARNPLTGVVTNVISPDTFPVRDFPNARTRETGVFVQDEMEFLDGTLTVIPGVRFDRYELEPRPDAIFAEDNPGVTPTDLDVDNVSPKLGALWWFTPNWAVTAQYAEGFRAPPYNDVNVGFTNLQFGYTAIPNPDLEPESSKSWELGLRASYDWGRLSLTGFYNRYEDFIESLVALDPSDPNAVPGLITFQSQNLTEVTIRGAEAAAMLDFGAFNESLDGFSLRASASYARGQDESADEPLASIDPLRVVAGLAYDNPGDTWGAEFIVTGVRAQNRLPDIQSSGYALMDLLGYWRPVEGFTVNAGVFNLADRSYVEWSDARLALLGSNSAVIDRFTRPGRNVGVNVRYEF
jgi:hemoglobin/transferrin/lactoferrin receptor protein